MAQRLSCKLIITAAFALPLAGCTTGGAIQPDRAVFSLDGNYQRSTQYDFGIEEAFDRTVKAFRDAGYRLDVADKATGEISGERNTGGANTPSTDKGLKFYALVLPTETGKSQVAVKIVQIIKHGSIVNSANTEIIVNDAQMYQYLFQRIADVDMSDAATAAKPAAQSAPQIPPAWGGNSAQPTQYPTKGYGSGSQ